MRLLIEGAKGKPDFDMHVAALEGSEAADRFKKLGPVVEVKSKSGLNLSDAKKIAHYCTENKIQILDAQTSRAHSLSLLVKFFNPELKLIVHRRVDNLPGKDPLNLWKYRTKKVDHYIAISEAIEKVLHGQGIDPSRISVVRSATDSSVFEGLDRDAERKSLAQAFSLDPKIFFVGNASALSHQKGYDTLIRAMKILIDQGEPIHCFIAGDGDLRDQLEKLRNDSNLDYDVTFLGFIKEVPTFLSALDVLAVPSNNEGLGTIILDGIHAGCAIVASEVGGIPEMVKHQETGLLVPPGDPKALADALKRMMISEELRNQTRVSAKQLIQNNFSIDAMVNGNFSIYQKVLSH